MSKTIKPRLERAGIEPALSAGRLEVLPNYTRALFFSKYGGGEGFEPSKSKTSDFTV